MKYLLRLFFCEFVEMEWYGEYKSCSCQKWSDLQLLWVITVFQNTWKILRIQNSHWKIDSRVTTLVESFKIFLLFLQTRQMWENKSFLLLHRSKTFHAVLSFQMTCWRWNFTKTSRKSRMLKQKGNNRLRCLLLRLHRSLTNPLQIFNFHEIISQTKYVELNLGFNGTFSFPYFSRLIHNKIWIQFACCLKADYEFILYCLS